MISHARAQALVSARLDAPLDPLEQRELLAHLATCPACRAFAQQTEAMTQGLRALPVLPASPTVSRVVLERINAGRSPWARFGDLFAANPVPAAALALVALLLVGGLTAARFTELDVTDLTGDGDEPRSLMAPTEPSDSIPALGTGESTEPTPPPNITVTLTPTAPMPDPTDTAAVPATATATASVRLQIDTPEPTPTETAPPTPTTTTEPTATAEPTATDAPAPTATDEPTPTPTATLEPTATDTPPTPTEPPTATAPPPTATTTPEPTATNPPAPTETPSPTETNTPAPTATDTPAPTPTNTPEPTATNTPPPTETPAPTETPPPTATNTPEPTETPPPTATDTPAPTPTPPPTDTPVPTATPSPTEEPEDTSPAIVPVNGPAVETETDTETEDAAQGESDGPVIVDGEPVTEIPDDDDEDTSGSDGDDGEFDDSGDDDGDDDSSGPGSGDDGDAGDQDEDNSGSGSGDDDDDRGDSDSGVIVPIGEQETAEATEPELTPTETAAVVEPLGPTVTDAPTGTASATTSAEATAASGQIVPIGDDGGTATDAAEDATTSDAAEGEVAPEEGSTEGLGNAPEFAPAPSGGPQRLALGDGAPVLADAPGIASLASGDGVLQTVATENGQAVQVCAEKASDVCVVVSADIDGEATVTPIGWVEGRAIYVRAAGGSVTYVGVDADGGNPTDLVTGGPEIAPEGPVIDLRGQLLVRGAAEWILLDGIEGQNVGPDPYATIDFVRTRLPNDLVGFYTGGQVVIAPETQPGTPAAQFSISAVDFDVSPNGESIAVSTGETIVITDFAGNQLGTFPNPTGASIGSVLWLDGGIYFVDATNGVIRVVDPGDAA